MEKKFKSLPQIIKIVGGSGALFDAARHAMFHRRQYDIIKSVDQTKLKLPAGLLEEYGARSDAEVEANMQSTMSANTALLREKDDKRDQLLLYIFGKVRNELRSPVEARAAAAHRVTSAIGVYKDIRIEPLDKETLHIQGLLRDIEPISADITTLGLTTEFADLKTVNEEYETLSAKREDTTALTKGPSAKEIRPFTDAAYEVVCQYIQAAYLNATTDEDRKMLEDLADRMNRTVVKFRASQREQTAQKHTTKKPKKPGKDDGGDDIHLPEEEPKKPEGDGDGGKKPEDNGGDDIHQPED